MPVYIIAIIISFFASIIGMVVKENRNPPFIFFPVFLLLTVIVEYYGAELSGRGVHTVGLYNIFTFCEFLFYMVFFRYLFQSATVKRNILLVMLVYFVITITNILFFQGKTQFHSYTYMLGCLLIVGLSIFYFYFLFRFPETGTLTQNPYFWIVTGLMFFDTCTFTFYGLNNFIADTMQHYDWVMFFVSDFLNILLYTSFTIGFLCKINIRKLLGSF